MYTSRIFAFGAPLALVTLFLAPACGPGQEARSVPTCSGEERPALDCSAEFKYDGRKIEGGFSAAGIGGVNAKTEEAALRAIDKETEQYVAQSRRLCDEYNKCVVDKATYSTRSENLRRRMSKAPELLDEVKSAKDEDARRKALAKAYVQLVPDESRRELALDFAVEARSPEKARRGRSRRASASGPERGWRSSFGPRRAPTCICSRRARTGRSTSSSRTLAFRRRTRSPLGPRCGFRPGLRASS
jgi:hypothetical protein